MEKAEKRVSTAQAPEDTTGKVLVYCRYVRLKGGRIIYPKKAKVFRFWVTPKDAN